MVAEARLRFLRELILVWREFGEEAQELVPIIERGVKAIAVERPGGVRGTLDAAGIDDSELDRLVLRDALLSERIG